MGQPAQFSLACLPGREYLLEAPDDFRSWFPIRTNIASGYLLQMKAADAVDRPQRFYSAKQ